jgi:Ca2+-binding RTX toxin-like protein
MTTFTANQQVLLTAASIGTWFTFLTSNPHVEVLSTTELKFENGGGTIELDFRGSGFHVNPITGTPNGGTLTSLQINEPAGTMAYKFAGMAIPITTAVADIQAHNWGGLLNLFMGGNDVIMGSPSGDYLNGFGGNDRINGGGGNDTLVGGPGNDTFIFRPNFGEDVIKDFNTGTLAAHDTIELHSVGIAGFSDLVHNHATVTPGGVVITDGTGDTITLRGITKIAQLHSFDFHFLA